MAAIAEVTPQATSDMGMPELERRIDAARGYASSFFLGPRDAALVAAAEASLGLVLPPTYRRFVSELGAGNVGGREFYGVTTDNFVSASVPNGIWLTLSEREQSGLPSALVIVGEDGLGGYFVLNTSRRDADGESPVAIWTPGGGGLEAVAPTSVPSSCRRSRTSSARHDKHARSVVAAWRHGDCRPSLGAAVTPLTKPALATRAVGGRRPSCGSLRVTFRGGQSPDE